MDPINQIKRFLLRALLNANGEPVPEDMLRDQVSQVMPGVLRSDVTAALGTLESIRLISGVDRKVDGVRFWALTTAGIATAREL